jgi:hypothetical protein
MGIGGRIPPLLGDRAPWRRKNGKEPEPMSKKKSTNSVRIRNSTAEFLTTSVSSFSAACPLLLRAGGFVKIFRSSYGIFRRMSLG